MKEFSEYIEYTNLNHTLNAKQIKEVVQTALDRKYGAVVLPFNCISIAKKMCEKTTLFKERKIRIATVYGFPFDKYDESIVTTLRNEYTDLDMVFPVQMYYYNNPPFLKEIKEILVDVRKKVPTKKFKLILETQLMRDKENQIKELAAIAEYVGVDVLKTSTGMIKRKENAFEELVDSVKIIKKYWGGQIKASGGIRTKEEAQQLIDAGADFIGTSKEL